MIYARIVGGVVQDVITPPPGFELSDCLHPSLVHLYVPIPDGVVAGATYDASAQVYTNPVEPEPETGGTPDEGTTTGTTPTDGAGTAAAGGAETTTSEGDTATN